jgi:hypothetical protein
MVQILASCESKWPIHYYDNIDILSWQPEHLEKVFKTLICTPKYNWGERDIRHFGTYGQSHVLDTTICK